MIRTVALLLLALVAGAPTSVTTAARERPEEDLASASRAFVDLLAGGEFAAAVERFDATMAEALPAARLREAWQSIQAQAGPFRERTGVRTEKEGGFRVAYVACRFAAAPIDAKIVYDDRGRIAGLFFVPGKPAAAGESASETASGYRESGVVVGEEPWRLPGTLSLPAATAAAPGVVLVHGSGPHDRDETVGPNRPFRDLAAGLAAKGIAVLRYEKRTLEHAAAIAAMRDRVTLVEETIDDAVAAVRLLRRTRGIDPQRIFVLGHSLGGTALPRVAEREPSIAGLILVAASSRPLEDLILDQVIYLSSLGGEPTAEAAAGIEQVRAQVARVKDPELLAAAALEDLPLGIGRAYWEDLARHPAPGIAARLSQPMFVLQGGRDYQVTVEDLDGWKAALAGRDNVVFRLYADLNHLLIRGRGASTPEEYGEAGHVDQRVIDDVSEWIHATPRRAGKRD